MSPHTEPREAAPTNGRILAFATQGAGGGDERRIADLLSESAPELFPFHRGRKLRSFFQLLCRIVRERPDLTVMEGTGIAGGAACILGRLLFGVPYVVSSGDAVAPWVGSHYPILQPVFALYERLLCRVAAGFIGWTPYLVGRALGYGTPRAMTAAGWAGFTLTDDERLAVRCSVRAELGIPRESLVFGIVGSLAWHRRYGYCYGHELVQALRLSRREDVCVLIVGAGSGRGRLAAAAASRLGRAVFLTGAVPPQRVRDMLCAMDVGSLPQSVDGVGSFRYTTKLSEYLAAGLPVITGQVPLAYDLDHDWLWRLPGSFPWDRCYVEALAALMNRLTPREIAVKRSLVPRQPAFFERDRQVARVKEFVQDLLNCRKKAA